VAVALANLDREPDAAWRIRPARIPGYNAILHAGMFPLDPMTGLEARAFPRRRHGMFERVQYAQIDCIRSRKLLWPGDRD